MKVNFAENSFLDTEKYLSCLRGAESKNVSELLY